MPFTARIRRWPLTNWQHGSDWGYCEVNLNSGALIAALRQQDLLYSVTEMADDSLHTRIVGVIPSAAREK